MYEVFGVDKNGNEVFANFNSMEEAAEWFATSGIEAVSIKNGYSSYCHGEENDLFFELREIIRELTPTA